jgi:branched-chain amino acid transport system ATP-binding protein
MTVEDNLVLGGYLHRRNKRPGELDRVFALFPRLVERRKQQARTLSGGERQMLALGRALMGRPRLLMLDEPSLGLAPRTAADVFRVIAGLPEQGISVLLVEQNARAALRIADYAYVLETGQITLQGPAKTLQSDPKIISTYLGLAATIEPGAPSKSERSISADE